jgi:hypothetical protein
MGCFYIFIKKQWNIDNTDSAEAEARIKTDLNSGHPCSQVIGICVIRVLL